MLEHALGCDSVSEPGMLKRRHSIQVTLSLPVCLFLHTLMLALHQDHPRDVAWL